MVYIVYVSLIAADGRNPTYTVLTSKANQAIGIITLDREKRLTNRHFMDGLLNLSNNRGEEKSGQGCDAIDSISTVDSGLTLRLEDEAKRVKIFSEADGSYNVVGHQHAVVEPEGRCNHILDLQNRPEIFYPQHEATETIPEKQTIPDKKVIPDDSNRSQLDIDEPVPIIIPDDFGFKRATCRHVRKKRPIARSSDGNQPETSYGCDDCETDYDNEQMQQIQPLLVLSRWSLPSYGDLDQMGVANVATLSLANQQSLLIPQTVEVTHDLYQSAESVFLDIQPTSATSEKQILLSGTLDSEHGAVTDKERSQMYHVQDTVMLSQRLGEQHIEATDVKGSHPMNKTVSSDRKLLKDKTISEDRPISADGTTMSVDRTISTDGTISEAGTISVKELAKLVIGNNRTELAAKQTNDVPTESQMGKLQAEKLQTVIHVYPERNPHIDHSQSRAFLDRSEDNDVKLTEKNTYAAKYNCATKAKSATGSTDTISKRKNKDIMTIADSSKTSQGKLGTKGNNFRNRASAKTKEIPSESVTDKTKEVSKLTVNVIKDVHEAKNGRSCFVRDKGNAATKQAIIKAIKEKVKSKNRGKDTSEPLNKPGGKETTEDNITQSEVEDKMPDGKQASGIVTNVPKTDVKGADTTKISIKPDDDGKQVVKHNGTKPVSKSVKPSVKGAKCPTTDLNKTTNKEVTVYDFNEREGGGKYSMKNFLTKQRNKRKRKQLKNCIVHLQALTDETLSRVLSNGSVTLNDDSSVASSEFSKTTDTRMGDGEADDSYTTTTMKTRSHGTNDEVMKKVKKRRKRKPKGYQYSMEWRRKKPKKKLQIITLSRKGIEKVPLETPQEVPSYKANYGDMHSTKILDKGSREGSILHNQAVMFREDNDVIHASATHEINNNVKPTQKPNNIPLQEKTLIRDYGSCSQLARNIKGVVQLDSLELQKHRDVSSETSSKTRNEFILPTTDAAVIRLHSNKLRKSHLRSTASESEIDREGAFDFMRYDRGLSGRASPESFTIEPTVNLSATIDSGALVLYPEGVKSNGPAHQAGQGPRTPVQHALSIPTEAVVSVTSGQLQTARPPVEPTWVKQGALNSPVSLIQSLISKLPGQAKDVRVSQSTGRMKLTVPRTSGSMLSQGPPGTRANTLIKASESTQCAVLTHLGPTHNAHTRPDGALKSVVKSTYEPVKSVYVTAAHMSDVASFARTVQTTVTILPGPGQSVVPHGSQTTVSSPVKSTQTAFTGSNVQTQQGNPAGPTQTSFTNPVLSGQAQLARFCEPIQSARPAGPMQPARSSQLLKTARLYGRIQPGRLSASTHLVNQSGLPRIAASSDPANPSQLAIPSGQGKDCGPAQPTRPFRPMQLARNPIEVQPLQFSAPVHPVINFQPRQPKRYPVGTARPAGPTQPTIPSGLTQPAGPPGPMQPARYPVGVQPSRPSGTKLSAGYSKGVQPAINTEATEIERTTEPMQPTRLLNLIQDVRCSATVHSTRPAGPKQNIRVHGPVQSTRTMEQIETTSITEPLQITSTPGSIQSKRSIGSVLTAGAPGPVQTMRPPAQMQIEIPITLNLHQSNSHGFRLPAPIRRPVQHDIRTPLIRPSVRDLLRGQENQIIRDQISRSQMSSCRLIGSQISSDQLTGSSMSSGQHTESQLSNGQLSGNQMSGGQLAESQVISHEPTGNQMSSGQHIGSEIPNRQMAGGQINSGHWTGSQMPSGRKAGDQVPVGQLPRAQVIEGPLATDQRRYSQIPSRLGVIPTLCGPLPAYRQGVQRGVPPSAYNQSAPPRRGPDGSSVITAVPIREGQPIPRSQRPPQRPNQPFLAATPQASSCTTSQTTTYDNLAKERIGHIYENITQTSKEGVSAPDDGASGNTSGSRKRHAEEQAAATNGSPLKKSKPSKFKCGECSQQFNHEWLIKDHIRMAHKFRDVDSCIIHTSAKIASSRSHEPDANPVNLVINKCGNHTETNEIDPKSRPVPGHVADATELQRQEPVIRREATFIDLTTDYVENNVHELTGARADKQNAKEAVEEHTDPETGRIRNIMTRMKGEEYNGLSQIAKNMKSGDRRQRKFGGPISSQQNRPESLQQIVSGQLSIQMTTSSPESTELTTGGPVLSPPITSGHVLTQHTTGSPVSTRLTTNGPVSPHQTTGGLVVSQETTGGPVSIQRTTGGPVSTQPTFGCPVSLEQSTDDYVTAQQTVPQASSDTAHQQQSAGQQASSGYAPSATSSTAFSHQRTQTSGRPVTWRRQIDIGRHEMLAPVLASGPEDLFGSPPGALQLGDSIQQRVTLGQFQHRLNEVITITQPNKHGWDVLEFQQKFSEYLMAPQDKYKIITDILQNKRILGLKVPSLDEFKQIVADDIEAEILKTREKSLDEFKQAVPKDNTAELVKNRVKSETRLSQQTQDLRQSVVRVSNKTNQSQTRLWATDQSQLQVSSFVQSQPSAINTLQSPSHAVAIHTTPAEPNNAVPENFRFSQRSHHMGCTLLYHPSGESCAANMSDRIQSAKGPEKPRGRFQCRMCGKHFRFLWKKDQHMEDMHNTAMSSPPVEVMAATGIVDKNEILVAKTKSVKPMKVEPVATKDNATSNVATEFFTDCPSHISVTQGNYGHSVKQCTVQLTQNNITSESIPLPVIHLLNKKRPLLPKCTRVQEPLLATSSGIQNVLFSESTAAVPHSPGSTAVPSTPSTTALPFVASTSSVTYIPSTVTVTFTPSTAVVSLTPSTDTNVVTRIPSTTTVLPTSSATYSTPLKILASLTVKENQGVVSDTVVNPIRQSGMVSSAGVPVQLGPVASRHQVTLLAEKNVVVDNIGLPDPNVQPGVSVNPQVTHLKKAIQTVAAAATSKTTGPNTPPEGASSQPNQLLCHEAFSSTPQQIVVTSIQQHMPIPTTQNTASGLISPTESSPLITKTDVLTSQCQIKTAADSDAECLDSVQTRPSGLRLLLPTGQTNINIKPGCSSSPSTLVTPCDPHTTDTVVDKQNTFGSCFVAKLAGPISLRTFDSTAIKSPVLGIHASMGTSVSTDVSASIHTGSTTGTYAFEGVSASTDSSVLTGDSAYASKVDKDVRNRRRGQPTRAIRKRITERGTSCSICGKKQTNIRGRPHKCLVHACIWCDKSCDTASQLMDHVKIKHPMKHVYECEVCRKGFNVKGTLERHMFVHSKKKEYKCNICKLAFTQSNNLKRHIAIHTGQKAFNCGECDKAFTSKYNLSQHLLVHFPKRTTYSCRFCKKTFLFSRTRDKHEFTHFGFTELQCSKCKKKFWSLKSLEAHIDIYHEGIGEAEGAYYDYADDAMSKTGSDVTMSSQSSSVFAATDASSVISEISNNSHGAVSKRKRVPAQGRRSVSPRKITLSMTSNKKQRKHICPICNQKFFFLLHLQEHMQSHKVPNTDLYECTQCDQQFCSSETYRLHIDTHPLVRCTECDETFKLDVQLAEHTLTEH